MTSSRQRILTTSFPNWMGDACGPHTTDVGSETNDPTDFEIDILPHIPNELAKAIERRSSRAEVENKGILKSHVQELSERLSRKATASRLELALHRRPSADALKESRILNENASSGPADNQGSFSNRTGSEMMLDQMERGEQIESSLSNRTESDIELDQMEKGVAEAAEVLTECLNTCQLEGSPNPYKTFLPVAIDERSIDQW